MKGNSKSYDVIKMWWLDRFSALTYFESLGDCQHIGGVGLVCVSTSVTWFREEVEKFPGLSPAKVLVMRN